jgi:hypothetical protein
MATFDEDSGTVSAAGKNTRYNSLLIDGVPTNDSFGLSESGLPALKQPFSLEAISEVSVQISPYTVENAGFTGASVSAVTKSGTNEFSGSFFGFYRDESMVGELEDVFIVNENKTVPRRARRRPLSPLLISGNTRSGSRSAVPLSATNSSSSPSMRRSRNRGPRSR